MTALTSLQEEIRSFVRKHGNLERVNEGLAVAYAKQVDIDYVEAWLAALAEDESGELEAVAPLLGHHPLGFTKIVLWNDNETGCRLRLHVWESVSRPLEAVHNHRFNFVTAIVEGSYVHEQYLVDSFSPGDAKLASCERLIVGDAYALHNSCFHRTIPDDSVRTMSLVLRSRSQRSSSTSLDLGTGQRLEHFGVDEEFRILLARLSEDMRRE